MGVTRIAHHRTATGSRYRREQLPYLRSSELRGLDPAFDRPVRVSEDQHPGDVMSASSQLTRAARHCPSPRSPPESLRVIASRSIMNSAPNVTIAPLLGSPGWFQRALAVPCTDNTVDVGGGPIHSLAWGPTGARGLVFVHGGGAHAHWWTHVAASFANEFRVIALDLSGHGDSTHQGSTD